MAEVHPEGNPHNDTHYPTVLAGSFNRILQKQPYVTEVEEKIKDEIPEVRAFSINQSINHKRNGEHIVFQFKPSGEYQQTMTEF